MPPGGGRKGNPEELAQKEKERLDLKLLINFENSSLLEMARWPHRKALKTERELLNAPLNQKQLRDG